MRTSAAPRTRTLALVAVLALVVGIFGATTGSYAATLTKKQVKKIAAKVVDKKAASLTVSHAQSATTATTAASAATATNAGNSSQLDGKAPAAYLDRVAHANLTTSVEIDSGQVTQIMNPVSITVPEGVAFLHVTGVAGFSGGSANVRAWPQLDGPCNDSGAGYNHSGFGHTANQTNAAINYVAAVAPGNHSVRMCVLTGGAGVFASARSLTITTVASDFNG